MTDSLRRSRLTAPPHGLQRRGRRIFASLPRYLASGHRASGWLVSGLMVGMAFGQAPEPDGVPATVNPAAAGADEPATGEAGGISWPEGFAAERVAERRDSAAQPTLEPFDRLAAELIREHHLPGLAIAVTDAGRLVHACGYGCGDLTTGEGVKATSLFRIASVSKPITAVAMLRCVDQQRLRLDDLVTQHLAMDAEFAAAESLDPRWRTVRIEHLLQHRGGWDREASFDAMFQSVRFAKQLGIASPAGARDTIRAMLTQPLDFDPGTRYAYSNFGYNLLGRVIENLSGETYESYVRRQVLEPLGITAMRIGATRRAGRVPGEVAYYHPGEADSVFAEDLGAAEPHPYGGWYLEAMDAHGGWIASAVDLAKFARAFDDPAACPILSQESVDCMYRRPPPAVDADPTAEPPAVYYSLGWNNRQVRDDRYNRWHVGSLPGTTAILIRRHDGKNFIALVNTRHSPITKNLAGIIDRSLHAAAAEVESWPTADLFPAYD